MKNILFVLMACLLSAALNSATAQDYPRHTIHLKDSTSIKGTIKSKTKQRSLILTTKSGEDIEIPYIKIKSVARNSRPIVQPSNVNSKPGEKPAKLLKENSFINHTEIAQVVGIGNVTVYGTSIPNQSSSLNFRTVNGYQFGKLISLGIGVGADFYAAAVLLPVTADARLVFLPTYFSPVLNLNAGYAYNTGRGPGGFTANPSIGCRSYFSHRNSFLVNVGYKWVEGPVRVNDHIRTTVLQFVTIGGGVTF